jgi:hypothetical protein
MKARHFHHQPRLGVTAIGRIAHAVEDDDQIETWMIDQAQEPSGNRRTVVGAAQWCSLRGRSVLQKNPEIPLAAYLEPRFSPGIHPKL